MHRQRRIRAVARGSRSSSLLRAVTGAYLSTSSAVPTAAVSESAAARTERGDRAKMATSPLIVDYYVRQGIFPRDDVPAIVETLEAPLPACFRVNASSRASSHIVERLLRDFPALFEAAGATAAGGAAVTSPRWAIAALVAGDAAPPMAKLTVSVLLCCGASELEWFPAAHGAWQLDCGKTALAKLARGHVPLRTFRDFLLFHTAEGNITRQEAASMIPPLLLDVQPHHRVLDLCAAPGSKTSQVMEALQLQRAASVSGERAQRGLIVANDANEKRGYLLVHQLQRLGLTDAVVTCHLGQQFPGLYSRVDSSGSAVLKATDVFDRIICDVPCSGDGTIRKNRNLWRQWRPGSALTLHRTQLELALRAAELLRSDGLMVYSTCSFNPIENEAVVSELLRRANGSLEVVDCSALLPGLAIRPGRSDWEVAWQSSKKRTKSADGSGAGATPPFSAVDGLEWFSDYNAVPEHLRGSRVLKSMFPPSLPDIRAQIAQCVRVFPTDQNTGGFFVALLRKVDSRTADDAIAQCWLESFEMTAGRSSAIAEAYVCKLCGLRTHSVRNCPLSRRMQRQQVEREKRKLEVEQTQVRSNDVEGEKRLHSYTKLRSDHWSVIQQFYGLGDEFPHENLYGRSDGAASICLVSPHIQQTCLAGHDLKILDTGVRVFARVPTSSDALVFRPTEDGLHIVLPFVTKRKILVDAADVELILIAPEKSEGGAATKSGGAHLIERFTVELQTQASEVRASSGVGPVLLVSKEEPGGARGGPVALPAWLGHKTLALLVDEATRKRLQVGEDGVCEAGDQQSQAGVAEV